MSKKKSKQLYSEMVNVLMSANTKNQVATHAEKKEMAMTAYIREAIREKLERDGGGMNMNKQTRRDR